MDDEHLIYYGGAVKALDDSGKVGGHLILWGSADATDAVGDYFTPETDLGRHLKSGLDLYYIHGLPRFAGQPNPLDGQVIGDVQVKTDDAGLWMEGQLEIRGQYEAKILEMVRAGKLGLSSGAVSHLVRREKQANGSTKVLRWPVAEASLTPAPGEPRTRAVAIKSLLDLPSEPETDLPAAGESFLETCLRSASDLEQASRRFAKLGPAKRAAIKTLRDSLDVLLRSERPDDEAERQRVDDLLNRYESRKRGLQ